MKNNSWTSDRLVSALTVRELSHSSLRIFSNTVRSEYRHNSVHDDFHNVPVVVSMSGTVLALPTHAHIPATDRFHRSVISSRQAGRVCYLLAHVEFDQPSQ